MTTENGFSIVFQGTATEAQNLHNILEAEGIENFLQNENMRNLFPHYGGFGSGKSVKLLVSNKDIAKVQEIIRIYFNNK